MKQHSTKVFRDIVNALGSFIQSLFLVPSTGNTSVTPNQTGKALSLLFFFFVMITLEFIWFDTILYFSIHLGDSSRQASFQVCYTKWFYICICIMERTAHRQQISSPTYLYLLLQAPWFATFLREIMRAVFLISD